MKYFKGPFGDCIMRHPRARFLIGLAVAIAAHAAALGTIAGTASDPQGQPIGHGQIQLLNLTSGNKISGKLRANGSYVFENLPEGSYSLSATAPGYHPAAPRTVLVRAGEITPLDLVFQQGRSWWPEVSALVLALWGLCVSLLAAVFGPRLYQLFTQPRLSLEILAETPYAHWINPRFPEPMDANGQARQHAPGEDKQIDIYFSRLIIRNDGRSEAERVEVSVRRVFRADARNHWDDAPGRFVPLNLRWSNTWDIVRAGEDVPGESRILTKDRISAGGERLCDLGFIVDPSLGGEFCRRARLRDRPRNPTPDSDSGIRFYFAFEFIRDQERHSLTPGTHLLEIVADALRVHPQSFWIELKIPGTLAAPKNEEERKRGLPDFRVRCHDNRPPAVTLI